MMGGNVIKSFYSGGYLYQVRAYQHTDYGEIYKIWEIDEDFDEGKPELLDTVYRKQSLDAFILNIYDANYEYDMNL